MLCPVEHLAEPEAKGKRLYPDPSRGGEGGVLKELFHLKNEGEGRWLSSVISHRSTEN